MNIPMMGPAPNLVDDYDDYYISYNPVDVADYGDVTTALVVGKQMDHFYILNGDHRDAYAQLGSKGLDASVQYFKDHSDQHNFRSDRLAIP